MVVRHDFLHQLLGPKQLNLNLWYDGNKNKGEQTLVNCFILPTTAADGVQVLYYMLDMDVYSIRWSHLQ